MNIKKVLPVFIVIFIAIIIIFSANTNIYDGIKKDSVADKPINKDSILKADSILRLYLLGRFDPSKDTNFTLVKNPYTNSPGIYILKDAYKAYKIMYDSAKKDGIFLLIISATRNFETQKSIWEGKFRNLSKAYPDSTECSKHILQYSSMPGTSRHHWGTDIDINSTSLSTFESGTGKKVYEWLSENAYKYGFCQPYSIKDTLRKTGYEEEKWHWSFYPVSLKLLEEYNRLITYKNITGFTGCKTAEKIGIIKYYVNAINQTCK